MDSSHEGDPEELRIVLLGVSGAGKSSIGNAILGREAFKESRSRESEKHGGRVEDRNISIIDTPGFFNPRLTEEELQEQMMKSLDLSHPGPHVFLLIVNLENFQEDQRDIVEEIQKNFGPQVFKFTNVLFIGGDKISKISWMRLMLSSKFQELVGHCRDKYHEVNSKHEIDRTHIAELLQKIEETVRQNQHQHYNNEIHTVSQIKKEHGEEKWYKRKESETKQKQEKAANETFTTNSIREERTTYSMTEEVKESIKKQEEVSFSFVGAKQKKRTEERIKRTTFTVTEEVTLSYASYETDPIYENMDTASLYRFEDFSNETPEKSGEMYQKKTYNVLEDLRIVLLGKTGAGKSSTGNTILGQKVFKEDLSNDSVTKTCQKHKAVVDCRRISVIDTPGLFDTFLSKEQLKHEIRRCIYKSVPGPHVFLLVIRLDVRFTDEEKNTVKWIQENFGEEASHYTIVLFNRGDQLKIPIETFLRKNKPVRELVGQCNGGYHVFNNTDEKNQSQVKELLKKIDTMVMKNGGQFYTNKMYKEAQRKRRFRFWLKM